MKAFKNQAAIKKRFLIIVYAVAIGVVLTGVSLAYQGSGRQFTCAPQNAGPLAELGVTTQYNRGWPLAYYREEVSENCYLPLPVVGAEQENKSKLDMTNLLIDVALWAGLGGLCMLGFRRKRR